jgi:hypothetical protein
VNTREKEEYGQNAEEEEEEMYMSSRRLSFSH